MKTTVQHLNRRESFRFLRKNAPFYLTGLILIFLMKYFYSRAGAAQLLWLLAPTAGWVSLLTGISFEWIQDVGYVNHGMKLIIAPSCSGMQFMLIAAAMLLFSFVHLAAEDPGSRHPPETFPEGNRPDAAPEAPFTVSREAFLRKGFIWIGVCLALSCLFTVFVNGLRIIAAIYLPLLFERLHLFGGFLTPDSLHTAIGTVVYFAALLTLCRLTGALFYPESESSLLRGCLPPVFWYFFIVLGIPFLNRAYEKNGTAFIAFAFLVTFCCCGILLSYCAGSLLRKRKNAPERKRKTP